MTARQSTDDSAEVLIAGAGIGGLAAALALAKRGIAVRVLERRAVFEPEGAGIQLGPNGTRILESLGVADALRPQASAPRCICVREGTSGEVLTRLPLGNWIAARHGAPYWVAHRRDVHAALLHAVQTSPLVTLKMDFAVVEAVDDETGASVTGASGQACEGCALISADGVWSGLRGSVFHCSPPHFSGKSAARSVIAVKDAPPDLSVPETTLWLFADAHVVHYPVSGGSELAIVVIADDDCGTQDWSAPVEAAWIDERLPPSAPLLRRLIDAAQTWRKWALQTASWSRTFAKGRIALLGDAAHPVMPFLAQGGVLALEDAVVLAAEVHAKGGDVVAALASYARRRRPRAARVAQASRQNGYIYHLSGPFALARNAVLRTVPAKRLMAGYDWLYGWRTD